MGLCTGAIAGLAETPGNQGGNLSIDPVNFSRVGFGGNANQIPYGKKGLVVPTTQPLNISSTTQYGVIRQWVMLAY